MLCAAISQEIDIATSADANLTAAADMALKSTSLQWQSCDQSWSFEDGHWAFFAKPAESLQAEQLAVTSFVVDTEPPDLQASQLSWEGAEV